MFLKSREDFREAKKSIINNWRKILISSVCMALVGGFSTLFTGYRYKSTALLYPEYEDVEMTTRLFGLDPSTFGDYFLQWSENSVNMRISEDICSSTSFLAQILPMRICTDQTNIKDSVSIFNYFNTPKLFRLYGKVKKTGNDECQIESFQLSSEQLDVIDCLLDLMTVREDVNDGHTTISVITENPYVSKQLVDIIANKLKAKIVESRQANLSIKLRNQEKSVKSAKGQLNHARELYADFVDKNRDVTSQSLMTKLDYLENEVRRAQYIYNERCREELNIKKAGNKTNVFYTLQKAQIPTQPLVGFWRIVLDYAFIGLTLSMFYFTIRRNKDIRI